MPNPPDHLPPPDLYDLAQALKETMTISDKELRDAERERIENVMRRVMRDNSKSDWV